MATCLPTYLAAMALKPLLPSPLKSRTTFHCPPSNWAAADLTALPVSSEGPSASRLMGDPLDSESLILRTTMRVASSWSLGVVGMTPAGAADAGAVVAVVAV